jgi:precorrin-2 dehydrogenase/sirohydrochlorin ferrochelatase
MIATGDEELGIAVARDVVAVRKAVDRLLARLRRPALARAAVVAAGSDHAPFAFPIMLDVRARRVVVAGGGREPAHKAEALAYLGAAVVVWAPVHGATAALEASANVELRSGPFDAGLLDGALLAIVATGDRDRDRRIATEARRRGVLVNTIDDIPYCDWSAPAILRRGDLTVSFATAGIAPALAVRLRDRLSEEIGPEYADLLDAFGAVRPRIMASGRSFGDRRRLWYELVDGPALGHLRSDDSDAAHAVIHATIDDWEATP